MGNLQISRLIRVIEQYPVIIDNTFVVINDEAPNLNLAKLLSQKGIVYIEFNYKDKEIKGAEKNIYLSNLLLTKFKEFTIDYCFCFGKRILKGELLMLFKNRIINFHPAVLPMFPGERSIDQALQANAFLLGNTAHFIDEGTDTGPVIMQSILHYKFFSAYEDVLGLQLPMINQVFLWIMENRLSIENNKVTITGAGYHTTSFYPALEIS